MDLTRQLRGKEVAAVITNGHMLVIQMHDRSEIRVVWVDDNGDVLKGRPLLEGRGVRLKCEGMRELIGGSDAGLGRIVVPKARVG